MCFRLLVSFLSACCCISRRASRIFALLRHEKPGHRQSALLPYDSGRHLRLYHDVDNGYSRIPGLGLTRRSSQPLIDLKITKVKLESRKEMRKLAPASGG